ncbi:winged helix-turn-helix domain-containing protein [Micromonospora taraxaci]|uniref:AfsR/SARP family transcriptional regulator n=1 Tax=Micromonospora taraxaci TaxID=1316803 RepID=UPI0033DB3F59
MQLSTRTLRLGTPKQQAIFAMLTVQPGRLVTVDDLVDELWADRPPRSAIANVRTYAANLRRTFEASPAGRGVIERQRNGYRPTCCGPGPGRRLSLRGGTQRGPGSRVGWRPGRCAAKPTTTPARATPRSADPAEQRLSISYRPAR